MVYTWLAEQPGEDKFGGYLIWSFVVMGVSILVCNKQEIDPYGKSSPYFTHVKHTISRRQV